MPSPHGPTPKVMSKPFQELGDLHSDDMKRDLHVVERAGVPERSHA